MTYGTAGLGTALHTAALLLEGLTGIKMTAVHYRGAAPALNDLIAGHINMITMGPSVALPAVKDGKINMLGFGSEQRVAQFPTCRPSPRSFPAKGSIVRPVRAEGHAPEILVKINADIQKVINDPEFRKRFLESLVVQPIPGSLDAFAEYLRKDSVKWAKVISAANLKID
jgi:tripartite-type tricarboxylate transporter receptor subunit TctC